MNDWLAGQVPGRWRSRSSEGLGVNSLYLTGWQQEKYPPCVKASLGQCAPHSGDLFFIPLLEAFERWMTAGTPP